MPTAVAPPVTDFAQFAASSSLGLTRFAYLLCGDHALAEDLVQEAFVQLYRRFGDDLTVAAPVAYARRAVVNTHISRRRLRASTERVTDQLPERPVHDTDGAERDAMWRALRTLPDRQRAVLVLRYYSDLSDDDIADALGCRPGTVRSLAARAFAALRDHPALQEGHR
ncbi:MAG: transcriptional regulator, LuxR family [Frankiales bacterium]|nr:transcriptional regulator, LuxR family [Frankiales bacterium]